MSKNYLQLDLGGKPRGLKFNMGTYKALAELTGQDPLKYLPFSESFEALVPFALNIFHAALLSNCASKEEQPDFTAADVARWFDELSITEVTHIINLHTGKADIKPSVNGEAGADTQPAFLGGTN